MTGGARTQRKSHAKGKITRQYSGELAQPLEEMQIGLLMDQKQIEFRRTERQLQELRKLHLLLDVHAIPSGPRQWFELALALARENVPGFKEKVAKGAPVKWTTLRLWLLAAEIHRQMDLGAESVVEASRRLASEEPWISFLGKWRDGKAVAAKRADALLEQYWKMPEGYRKAGEGVFRWNKHAGTLEKLDEMIMGAISKQSQN